MAIKVPTDIRSWQARVAVIVIFIFSILLRLPTLIHPLAEHHEYNTAEALINIESWRHAGGGERFNYVPLQNFQNFGDRSPVKSPVVDNWGNTLYIEYGPGWYMLPYFLFQILDWPAEPFYLKMLNLLFEFAAVIMFFQLSERLMSRRPEKYRGVIIACTLFIFSPAIMWYMGNGYVNTGIMLPLVMAVLWLMLPMVQSPVKMPFWRLGLIFLSLIVLIYIDWFMVFFGIVASIWSLTRIRRDKKYWFLSGVLILGSVSAVALVFAQLASYVGAQNVLAWWKQSFMERSVAHRGLSVWKMTGGILWFVLTGYFPVVLMLGWSFIQKVVFKRDFDFSRKERRIMGVYAVAVLVYNLSLMRWSSEHEFALVPLSVLVCYLAARMGIEWINKFNFYKIMGFVVVLSIAQYYVINRPGKVGGDGTRYDAYKKLGMEVKKLPEKYALFMNRDWIAPIDFYAQRNIRMVDNIDSARAFVRKWGVSQAMWIEQKNYKFIGTVVISPDAAGDSVVSYSSR